MNPNPQNIAVGDTVRIYFDHNHARGPFLAEVTTVRDRTRTGEDACISYVPEESGRNLDAEHAGIPYLCSVSYVIEVVRRGKQPATFHNLFQEVVEKDRENYRDGYWGTIKDGGVYICVHLGLTRLIMRALATVHGTIDRDLDMDRFHTQWERDQFRGRVAVPGGSADFGGEEVIAVRWKTFKKYVIANRHKILFTRREMERMGGKYHDEMIRVLLGDMDYDFGREEEEVI